MTPILQQSIINADEGMASGMHKESLEWHQSPL